MQGQGRAEIDAACDTFCCLSRCNATLAAQEVWVVLSTLQTRELLSALLSPYSPLSLTLSLSPRQTCKCGLINLLHVASVRDDDDDDNRSDTHAHSAASGATSRVPSRSQRVHFGLKLSQAKHITRPPNQRQIEGGRTRCQRQDRARARRLSRNPPANFPSRCLIYIWRQATSYVPAPSSVPALSPPDIGIGDLLRRLAIFLINSISQ